MNNPQALILLPRMQIQNANAVSGPLTWGFPSPTAFTGFVHALERRLADELTEGFGGVGIVCHKFEPQVTKPAGKYTQVFQLTRNPLGKDGKSAAIVEEGRTHMEISLVIAFHDYIDSDDVNDFLEKVTRTVHSMRLAGGSILPMREGKRYRAQYWLLPQDEVGMADRFRRFRRQLLPGFALVQREDRLQTRLTEIKQTNPQATALDALLDLSRLNIEPDQPNPDIPEEKQWGVRKQPGWLVPIPVGYAAISPLHGPGDVTNARDESTPFSFVENLYSLGEWLSPHRVATLQQILWHQHADTDKGIYQCVNRYPNITDITTNQ